MTEIMPSLLEKKLIFKRFKLVKLIYFSRFSYVYEGKNVIKNVPVAIKIEKKANCNFLESEAYILTNVKGIGIPELISYGKYGPFKILIEEFLGKTISSLWKSGPFKKDPSGQKNKYIKDICLFAMQGLERLKHIHDKNIIHRDIKADNFLIGRKDPDIIYLIDFGLAKKYRSSRTGKHIKFSNIRKLIGSMNYASCNAMKGYEISRRDDLESFGYLLIYLGKGGSIPWIKYFKKKDINIDVKELIILKTKMKITEENLCKGLPDEFIDYMKYVKKLEFEQEPDYKYLYSLFISILSKNETKKNITFFWITTKSNKDKKKLEEKESKKGNLFLNHIKNKSFSVRKSPLNRLYNKIKESLMNKNKLNNYYSINNKDNINNNMENSQKLVDLSHKNLNINLSDVHNYHILNNNVSNTEKDIKIYLTSSNSACHINEAIKKKARELTQGKSTPLQKARAIFNFVRDRIAYKGYDNSIQGAGKTLLLGRGNCCDQTNLLVALCRASKIPARFSHGLNTYFYLAGKTYGGHVWGQILIGKIWYAADTTSNRNSFGTIVNWNINKFDRLRQYINLPF